MGKRYPEADLTEAPTAIDDRQRNTLTVQLHYVIPHFLDKDKDVWNLRYKASNLGLSRCMYRAWPSVTGPWSCPAFQRSATMNWK